MEVRISPRPSTNYQVITLSDADTEAVGCSACSTCNRCLAGQTVVSLDGRNYCWHCFREAFGRKCLRCQELITGVSHLSFIYYNDQVWHRDCFRRYTCLG